MVIFHSYVKLPEGTTSVEMWCQALVGDVVFPHVFVSQSRD